MEINHKGVVLDSNELSHDEVYELMHQYFEFIKQDLNDKTELKIGKTRRGNYIVSRFQDSPTGFRVMNLIPFSEVEMIMMMWGYFREWVKEKDEYYDDSE